MPDVVPDRADADGGRETLRPLRVLVVDPEPSVRRLISGLLREAGHDVCGAATFAGARRCLGKRPVDLAFIQWDLGEGDALALLSDLRRLDSDVQPLLLLNRPIFGAAVEAIRTGAVDVILKPLNPGEITARAEAAAERLRRVQRKDRRIARLKQVCRELNTARLDVRQQVDALCQDLVEAYRDLAAQVEHAGETAAFASLICDEFDVETVVRHTLEFLLHEAGPTNAAVFLPANADEYTLAGFVHHQCEMESAELLLEHMAAVVAPKLAECAQPVRLTDDKAMGQWFGDDGLYLTGMHLLGVPCRAEGETLAVIMLFRDSDRPFPEPLMELCTALACTLAEHLDRAIRIHHRRIGD